MYQIPCTIYHIPYRERYWKVEKSRGSRESMESPTKTQWCSWTNHKFWGYVMSPWALGWTLGFQHGSLWFGMNWGFNMDPSAMGWTMVSTWIVLLWEELGFQHESFCYGMNSGFNMDPSAMGWTRVSTSILLLWDELGFQHGSFCYGMN